MASISIAWFICMHVSSLSFLQDTRKAVPVSDWKDGAGRPVLLFGWRHLNSDGEEHSLRERLTGTHDLSIRLLEKYGSLLISDWLQTLVFEP